MGRVFNKIDDAKLLISYILA